MNTPGCPIHAYRILVLTYQKYLLVSCFLEYVYANPNIMNARGLAHYIAENVGIMPKIA
jgi:hypothetical protein